MSVLLIKGTSAPSACSRSEAPTGQTTFCFCAFRLCWAQSLKPRWVRPVGVFNGLKSAERWTSSSWEINKASREERESNKEKLTSLFVVFLCAFYSLLFKSSLIIQHIFKQQRLDQRALWARSFASQRSENPVWVHRITIKQEIKNVKHSSKNIKDKNNHTTKLNQNKKQTVKNIWSEASHLRPEAGL